jgi:hypothetical protein
LNQKESSSPLVKEAVVILSPVSMSFKEGSAIPKLSMDV